MQSFLYMRAG